MLTLIRGKHTIAIGGQYELGYDNYFQTNIAAGAFAFSTNWTDSNPKSPIANTGFPFADFLLGLADNYGSFVNQTEGVAQVPAQSRRKANIPRHLRQGHLARNPEADNQRGSALRTSGAVVGTLQRLDIFQPECRSMVPLRVATGTPGSPCPGDAFYVKTGVNGSRNNIPTGQEAVVPQTRFGL